MTVMISPPRTARPSSPVRPMPDVENNPATTVLRAPVEAFTAEMRELVPMHRVIGTPLSTYGTRTSPPWPASATRSAPLGRSAMPRGASSPLATVDTVHALVVALALIATMPRNAMRAAATTDQRRRLLILIPPLDYVVRLIPGADATRTLKSMREHRIRQAAQQPERGQPHCHQERHDLREEARVEPEVGRALDADHGANLEHRQAEGRPHEQPSRSELRQPHVDPTCDQCSTDEQR